MTDLEPDALEVLVVRQLAAIKQIVEHARGTSGGCQPIKLVTPRTIDSWKSKIRERLLSLPDVVVSEDWPSCEAEADAWGAALDERSQSKLDALYCALAERWQEQINAHHRSRELVEAGE